MQASFMQVIACVASTSDTFKLDGTGVVDDPCTDRYQREWQAGQCPAVHLLWQIDVSQDGRQVVAERVQLQPDFIVDGSFT